MRVLVTGAYGLIGSAILARLAAAGHELVGTGRSVAAARRRFPAVRWIEADFHRLTRVEDWAPLISRVDAVVNCVGAFQHSRRDDLRRIHVAAPIALFAACEQVGVRRVIHVSAVGVDAAATEFAATKAAADARLAASRLDWLILRPGIVLAPGVYGATAMMRGLAGTPWRTPLIAPDSRVQIVAIDDIAATVEWALGRGIAVRGRFDLVNPDPYRLGHIVAELRRWLGLKPQPVWVLPRWLAGLAAKVADALGWLGWRSPARSTALAQLAAAPIGDPGPWMAATGLRPRTLADILAAAPSTLQDRWFAHLYVLKPLAIACLAFVFIATGVISLGPGWREGLALLAPAHLPVKWAAATIIGGAVLDILLGIGVLVRRTARVTLVAMLVLTVLYLVIATVLAPALWADPLGRLLKTVPLMLLMLFTLAVLDER